MPLKKIAAALALCVAAAPAAYAQKWDMPTAYADSNYHTQNAKAFAEAVNTATGGDLEIVVHGGGSLYKGGEIKRAVQTGTSPHRRAAAFRAPKRKRAFRIRFGAFSGDLFRSVGKIMANRPPAPR